MLNPLDIKHIRYVEIFDNIPLVKNQEIPQPVKEKLEEFRLQYGELDAAFRTLKGFVTEVEKYQQGITAQTLPLKKLNELSKLGVTTREEFIKEAQKSNIRAKEQAKTAEEISFVHENNFSAVIRTLQASGFFGVVEEKIDEFIRAGGDPDTINSAVDYTIRYNSALYSNGIGKLRRYIRDGELDQFALNYKNEKKWLSSYSNEAKQPRDAAHQLYEMSDIAQRLAIYYAIEGDLDQALEYSKDANLFRDQWTKIAHSPRSKALDRTLLDNPQYFRYQNTIEVIAKKDKSIQRDTSNERLKKLKEKGFMIFGLEVTETGKNLHILKRGWAMIKDLIEQENDEIFARISQMSKLMNTWADGHASEADCLHLTLLYNWARDRAFCQGLKEPVEDFSEVPLAA